MTNIFVSSGVISIIYLIITFFRQKYVVKENKALKVLVTDAVMVFLSCSLGLFAIENLNNNLLNKSSPTAFVGAPDF